ncbi:MAG: 4-hydroxy-tetrahydrodipicolinate reductase [Candidatus Sumerlaeota bacterium]|nr:4-hydroxy-tetrahydrodipicolinate reductase [Candidatus Sumerlaeota bacterium]
MTLPIYLPGVAGRMGRMIAECIAEAKDLRLAAAFEAPGHPWIGRRLSELLGPAGGECVVADAPPAAPKEKRVVSVHFTTPEATVGWLDWSVGNACPMVIGTTGLKDEQLAHVREAAKKVAIVLAPNMSVGVNLLFALAKRAAQALGKDFDVEIAEMHHRFKKDAPSGTALRLGEVVAEGLGIDLKSHAVHGRSGLTGERPAGQIGFHALRGGDVVGEHTVTFAAPGERVELTHRAASRRTFAEGALRAARFLTDKKAGFFDMQEVLGLGA